MAYYCITCNNKSESNQDKSDCDPYIYEYKSHKIRKTENTSTNEESIRSLARKEKNITLSVSKENKVQMSKEITKFINVI